ncbi:c-type cytochrome biogenesis protein CcsB [Shimazuella sp. AN120528]|uniref:c-type cytochrome biogenesis protein CcsB n=1 Tax=Shimazuella soli TaxID=1892854 RepID=UPI001F110918|nr:c-type cytochrome biogenesis protein CcsB [Shimazuella soli]MCH5584291.1 c-type cytochrome biogenesis protein CcsB [Shimazuella soli]
MTTVMNNLLYGTFILYLVSAIVFVVVATESKNRSKVWRRLAIILSIAGVVIHVAFMITRIVIGGHFPTSNMFEFIAFLCFALVLAFIVIFAIYRTYVLGAFVMPLAVVLLAYAAVFPRNIQPLIPALQSHWLYIHVTTAALGQGAFAVSCVAGLIYLIYQVGKGEKPKHAKYLEMTLIILVMLVGFSIASLLFQTFGYQASFIHQVNENQVIEEYNLPPIVAPNESKAVKVDQFLSYQGPLFEAPSWMKGEKAASKFNSVIWGIVVGLVLYAIYRAIARKNLYQLLYPLVRKLDPELLDEISYRGVAIGYPLFTLGALIFAMIWANEAWGRPWGWDPKETWAFITWMFYSAYLHLRLSRGWVGMKSAWLAVGGFVIIMLNLIVINLVISGLHSYA